MTGFRLPYPNVLAPMLAMLLSIAALFPVVQHDLVNWDDHLYITEYFQQRELSVDLVKEVFTTSEIVGAYTPLTVLSWSVDQAISPDDPRQLHRTNLLLHLLNVLLVFAVTKRLSGRMDVAFLVATLFGIHPMHVEPVAWISARKDLLYSTFWLFALLAWQVRTKASNKRHLWYGFSLALFALSCLAKPMAVTFPVVLLLLDVLEQRKKWAIQIVEKLPYFAISIVVGLVAISAQKAAGASEVANTISHFDGAVLACWSFVRYVVQAVWPAGISPFYPYPDISTGLPIWSYVSIGLLFVGLALLWRYARHNRKLLFGFGFFAITIAPTLKLLPFGTTLMADRFTYLPYLGLFYMFGLCLAHLPEQPTIGYIKWGAFAVYCLALTVFSNVQSRVWHNGESLWSAVIEVYPDREIGYINLAEYYKSAGQLDLAESHYKQAVEVAGNSALALNDLAVFYNNTQRPELGLQYAQRALALLQTDGRLWMNAGHSLAASQRYNEADSALRKATELEPNNALAWLNFGLLAQQRGNFREALTRYSRAIEVEPNQAIAFSYRGSVELALGNYAAAVDDLTKALALDPDNGQAALYRSKAHRELGHFELALQDAKTAQQQGIEVGSAYIAWLQKRLAR